MNYYELLGIGRDAGQGDIKRAYYAAVKQHSPDFDPEGFRAVRTAYETLQNPKKRAEYDTIFAVDNDIQGDMLRARNLVETNKLKQASELLTSLFNAHPGSREVALLHARTLLDLRKSKTADAIAKTMLAQDPGDIDALLLRAEVSVVMGHTAKAKERFLEAVSADPANRRVWNSYAHFALSERNRLIFDVFNQAWQQDPNMFSDKYSLYLAATAYILDFHGAADAVRYFNKFTEHYIADKHSTRPVYNLLLNVLFEILSNEVSPFVADLEKILPKLEESPFKQDDDKAKFNILRNSISIDRLHRDDEIHDVLTDLTECLLRDDVDQEAKLGMEVYIVSVLGTIRPSIRRLQAKYPELFKLNQAFYLDALNPKKEESLTNKYYSIHRKLLSAEKLSPNNTGDELAEPPTTFVREAPKIGRNDPCPCGSGMKYKKCCRNEA
ncbi:MAG: DnaJ domain-containing protein [Defluviitaleaceae bacterium]|nr:DnaJ domain-containing protein [Defluviitaleaceae bacterium]